MFRTNRGGRHCVGSKPRARDAVKMAYLFGAKKMFNEK